jgi:hypothetical protein
LYTGEIMKNQIKDGFVWSTSIKKNGLERTILWRTWFHNGMTPEQLSENTGLSKKVCQKHLDKLNTQLKLVWNESYKCFKVTDPEKYKFEDLK